MIRELALLAGAVQAADLVVVSATIHQTDGGAAAGPAIAFTPGETIYFRAVLDGYKTTPQRRVKIRYRIEATDPAGVPIVEAETGQVDAELRDEDKGWKPVARREIAIPALAGSGTYRVRLEATDEASGVTVSREAAFRVSGRDVEPSDTLQVRNIQFFRSEEEAAALRTVAYRPGDVVWTRFDIIGYKLGEANRVHVSFRIRVTGPGGRLLWQQEEPTVEDSASFYPKRYVPCTINLTLQSNIRPDEYIIEITVRDHVGGQEQVVRPAFRVE
ncbi:MAG: hypothetical protein ACRD96_18865 [Bryobacteraceae bacterium]